MTNSNKVYFLITCMVYQLPVALPLVIVLRTGQRNSSNQDMLPLYQREKRGILLRSLSLRGTAGRSNQSLLKLLYKTDTFSHILFAKASHMANLMSLRHEVLSSGRESPQSIWLSRTYMIISSSSTGCHTYAVPVYF